MSDVKKSLEKAREMATLFNRRTVLLEQLESLDDKINAIGGNEPTSPPKKKSHHKSKTPGDDRNTESPETQS